MFERSPPASVGSMEDDNDDYDGNGLTLYGPPSGLEKVYDYESGGHHPVQLGDHLGKEGRYRVIHKLGNGGSANVWLCRDLEYEKSTYVGLKILMADTSTPDCREMHTTKKPRELGLDREVAGKYICLPTDQFQIDGPNGSYFCFVYPVLGPRVSCILQEFENPDKTLRKIALQAVQGMALLHSYGICHGDFRPSNILLKISGLDGLTEKQVIQALGEPKLNEVIGSSESPTNQAAPKYLFYPVDFCKVDSKYVVDQACIIDLGESFEVSSPPEDLGLPQVYCSPELMLDKVVGMGSDLWALGCTLFEIRTGRKLFDMFDDDMSDHLYYMVLLLGRLPEPWWTTWEDRKESFEDQADPHGRAIKAGEQPATEGIIDRVHPTVAYEPHSIEETLAKGLWYMDIENQVHRDILADEIEMFADVLGKLLKYNPSDRLSAYAVQNHKWFHM